MLGQRLRRSIAQTRQANEGKFSLVLGKRLGRRIIDRGEPRKIHRIGGGEGFVGDGLCQIHILLAFLSTLV